MKFPTVSGATLTGRAVTLPNDLDGDYNLLLISYERNQTYDVKSWLPFLQQRLENFPGIRYFRLPTMGEFSTTQREMIQLGMRMGFRDTESRDRIITLYLNVDDFNRRLGFPDTTMIRVLLTDRPGSVLWQSEGRFTHAKGQDLKHQLETLLARDSGSV